ncbi:MAG: CBS domain-containing protein [Halodesulfurarchaeum sp.]
MEVGELMTTDVKSVTESASLAEAVGVMLEADVGSVIVVDEDVPVGIVTETDVLRTAYSRDVRFSEIRVNEAMTAEVITIEPESTVRRAVESMNENHVKKLPVVSDFEVVGIVTLSDVVREHLTLISEAEGRRKRREDWFAEDD